jgi:RNA polymerase I-specific transcription initiation factor RRN7
VYHGDRARYHYFQCLQVVLRYQIKALTNLWKLPPEFEVRSRLLVHWAVSDPLQIVCRDIWALHLSTLPRAIPPEPLLHKEDGESEPPSPPKRSSERELAHPDVGGDGSGSESVGPSSSEEEDDPELEALLEQLSASSEDGDPDLSSAPIEHAHPTRKARGTSELPANTIAVLILACWTLRIPIIFRDFTK